MRKVFLLCVTLLLVSCSNLESRHKTAQHLAQFGNLTSMIFNTSTFKLQGYGKVEKPGQSLVVFIEGDGLAYINRSRPSQNPTPVVPISLQLAAISTSPNILYIARPCQYIELNSERDCGIKTWTTSRFSEAVIKSVNQAIGIGKKTAEAPLVHLVGYSGGGAVAVLVAARRQDIGSVRTLAGYLDHKKLNKIKKVTPLYGSLDPIKIASLIRNIPQLHITGSRDNIIPRWVAEEFTSAVGNEKCATAHIVDSTHTDGWIKIWKEIDSEIPKCRP